ncbi:MAG: Ig-like domain-containing protein, partial [Armatimonadota bacterium]
MRGATPSASPLPHAGQTDADGLETCRCLPNYVDCACGEWCWGNGTPDCSPYECNDWGCTAGWPVCGCDAGEQIPNCTPGSAWCFCDVAYCRNEPCGADNCQDYCWETQCPTCGGLQIEITQADPAGPRLYVNLGQTSTTITARVTRNGQPVEGATVHWRVDDPDEPWAPSYLDPVGGRCNCGPNCPDEGSNGKTNCACANRPPAGNCPSHNDDGEAGSGNDNVGGPGVLDPPQGQTGADGTTQTTLSVSSDGGDNYRVWAFLCPKPPEHPHGMAAGSTRFTVWRRIEIERDSMESQGGVDDFYQAAYNLLAGAFDDGYIELHLLPDWGRPGDDPDCDDDCDYVQLLPPTMQAFTNYADQYFGHPGHRAQYLGVNE